MHESLGEIVGQVLEAAGEAATISEPSSRRLRWLWWIVTAFLLALVVGLLTISLWWPR